MNENRYITAGWVSIFLAILFPIPYIIEGLTGAVYNLGEFDVRIGIGTADFLFLLFAFLSAYVLASFKSYLYENFSFKKIGTILNMAIFWHLAFFIISFVMELFYAGFWPRNDIGLPLFMGVFWIFGVVVFGIIDIIIGIMLLQHSTRSSTIIKFFAFLNIVIGTFELTVIFSFMTFILVPISFVLLAIIFFSKTKEVEFV